MPSYLFFVVLDEIQVEPIVPEGMEVEFTDNEIGEDLKSGVKLYG